MPLFNLVPQGVKQKYLYNTKNLTNLENSANSMNTGPEQSGAGENDNSVFQFVEFFTPRPMDPINRNNIDGFMPNCELLPDDKDFLLQRLSIDPDERKATIASYKFEWLAGITTEPTEHKKQNAGRYRANTWLRGNALQAKRVFDQCREGWG